MANFYVDFEGGNDQAGLGDSSTANPKTVTASSTHVLSDTVYKFDNSSLYMNADYNLILPDVNDFDFGTGDFCVRAWVYPTTTSRLSIFGRADGEFGMYVKGGEKAYVDVSFVVEVISVSGVTQNAWNLIECTRVGSALYLWVNGSGSSVTNTTNWSFGGGPTPGYNNHSADRFIGYYGELEVVKGAGRNTSSYTPPSTQFTPDSNTVLLMHFGGGPVGKSYAQRVKSLSAATSSRVAAGDTVRIKATPYASLVGSATWTQNSRTVTLGSAVTANITTCETAWTASTNVTCSTTATRKEGSLAAQAVIGSSFTTGKAAYFATGTLDLSGYQQVSFWVLPTGLALPADTLSLRLCTDTTGDTSVHTIPITASTPTAGQWYPVTVDLGTNLNSAIQSIALYQDADINGITVILDNIIACKAASSADALSLTSLIGKEHNLSWVASTAYSTNTLRRPTAPNRSGYLYKATTGGTTGSTEPTWPLVMGGTVTDGSVVWTCHTMEETWHGIKSINGTTVTLDQGPDSVAGSGRGYHGDTETINTYKIETVKAPILTSAYQTLGVAGTSNSPVIYSGGWNRTDMSTQVGETWCDGQAGLGSEGLNMGGRENVRVSHMGFVRFNTGIGLGYTVDYLCVAANNNRFYGIAGETWDTKFRGVQACNNSSIGVYSTGNGAMGVDATALLASSNDASGWYNDQSSTSNVRVVDGVVKNNGDRAVRHWSFQAGRYYGVICGNNAFAISASTDTLFQSCTTPEGQPGLGTAAGRGHFLRLQDHNQTAGNHINVSTIGSVESATDQRHTASGISWKFKPTSTAAGASRPLSISVAKIACVSGTPVSVTIWTRRDSTDIQGQLRVQAGQLAGVPTTTVACAPTINTWVQSSSLTFTPTANGVIDVLFDVWDGVGTTNAFWIDDIAVS